MTDSEMADVEKAGNSVWISSSDKKYVLTWADKVRLETKLRTYCPNANFEENFQKVLEKNHKYVHEVLIDINREYISCLEKLSDDFQEVVESFPGEFIDEFSNPTDPAILHHHAQVFRMSRFKLVWTHYEVLLGIYVHTDSGDKEDTLQSIRDKEAEMLCEIKEYIKKNSDKLDHLTKKIDKIDNQTEKPQETPEYVTEMIERGLLTGDLRVTKGLPAVVKWMVEQWEVDYLEAGIFTQFKKRDGTSFSLKTIQEDIKRVKNSQ